MSTNIDNFKVLMFNLYDEKENGWSIQLTTLEKCTDINEKFTSRKNLFVLKNNMNEIQVQEYIAKLLMQYMKAENVHKKVLQFLKIGVWSRYGVKIIDEIE